MSDLDALLDLLADKLADRVAVRLKNGNGNGHARPVEEADTLLTAPEAAQRLGVKPRWLYGHLTTLPFVVRLPGRSVRFSARGMQRFIERRRG